MRIWVLVIFAAACGSSSPEGIDGPPGHADAAHAVDGPPGTADAPGGGADARIPVDDPCFTTHDPGHHVFPCDGIDYDVEVPATCPPDGCGLIVDVHGLTMSAEMLEANDHLRARGSAAGFVVIQPNANPDPPNASWNPDTDDAKIYDFMMRAAAVYAIDPDRLHFTGFSQGGFMSWRFLCHHSDVLASVAPAAGASNCVGTPACSFTGAEIPARQIPVLYMHGTQDTNYVPFSCAQPQVDAMAAAWGLTVESVDTEADFTRTHYTGGVDFLAHDYTSSAQIPFIDQTRLLGHCFPGSDDPGGATGQLFPFGCDQPAAFVWGEELVSFFLAHPRS